jgi:hypothetical protein
VTITIVMISAKGMALRGSVASPAGTGITSYPPNAKISSRPVAERSAIDGEPAGTSRVGSTNQIPTMMKMASGNNLPIVSRFSTKLLWRMPRMLIAVMATTMAAMNAARVQPAPSAGT